MCLSFVLIVGGFDYCLVLTFLVCFDYWLLCYFSGVLDWSILLIVIAVAGLLLFGWYGFMFDLIVCLDVICDTAYVVGWLACWFV